MGCRCIGCVMSGDHIVAMQAGAEAQAVDPQPAVTVQPVEEADPAAAAAQQAAGAEAGAQEAGEQGAAAVQDAAEPQGGSSDQAEGTQKVAAQADAQNLPGNEQPKGEAMGDAAISGMTQQAQVDILPVEDFTSKTRQVRQKLACIEWSNI